MARKNFTKAIIKARFKHANRQCEKCGIKLYGGDYHGDHDNPDGLTGQPTFENCRILCLPCHAEKTKKDVAAIAEAQRREWKHTGPAKPPGKIKSAGFAKSGKQPKIDKSALGQLPRPSLYLVKS